MCPLSGRSSVRTSQTGTVGLSSGGCFSQISSARGRNITLKQAERLMYAERRGTCSSRKQENTAANQIVVPQKSRRCELSLFGEEDETNTPISPSLNQHSGHHYLPQTWGVLLMCPFGSCPRERKWRRGIMGLSLSTQREGNPAAQPRRRSPWEGRRYLCTVKIPKLS